MELQTDASKLTYIKLNITYLSYMLVMFARQVLANLMYTVIIWKFLS